MIYFGSLICTVKLRYVSLRHQGYSSLCIILKRKKPQQTRKILAKSDPGPKIPTLRARRHQVVPPPPDAAALPWGRGQVFSQECCSTEHFKQQAGRQSWPISPASWVADRAWALACGHLLLGFLNCFYLKSRAKIILQTRRSLL